MQKKRNFKKKHRNLNEITKFRVPRKRHLEENEDYDDEKLESIPLLLFGDYEIIIEKKA